MVKIQNLVCIGAGSILQYQVPSYVKNCYLKARGDSVQISPDSNMINYSQLDIGDSFNLEELTEGFILYYQGSTSAVLEIWEFGGK